MKSQKQFALAAHEIVILVSNAGSCFATDMITVHGRPVSYMYREGPDNDDDSGWRFFSGEETQEHLDNPENLDLFDVNTIANYDRDIIPYLQEPVGSVFERAPDSNRFRKVKSPSGNEE